MLTFALALLSGLSLFMVGATNTSGDPTNLSNWPPCAQNCIPIGLAPPVSCGSLSNLTCICDNPAFSLSIAVCEQTGCNATELTQIQQLSAPLCAPVGGLASNVTSAVVSSLGTLKPSATGNATTATQSATTATPTSTVVSFTGDAAGTLGGSFACISVLLAAFLSGLALM